MLPLAGEHAIIFVYNVLAAASSIKGRGASSSSVSFKSPFLGGLSLHLNHLIASRLGICYRQFGTLPIGIFLSNLDSRLDTSLMTSYGHFWHMSTFGNSKAVWVLLPKYGALRKSKFSRWRSDRWSTRLRGFRWADNWATWWYYFLGGATHLRGAGGCCKKKAFLRTFATA